MMKKSLLMMFTAGLTAVLAAGCVHFEYTGETAPAADVPVKLVRKCADPEKKAAAKCLGKAVVWGDYQDVSRDRLEDRLKEEAAARGANLVLITADQVVPSGTVVQVDPMVRTMEAVSPNNTYSMNQLQQDFDGGYGQADFSGKNSKPNGAVIRDYTRIIRAEFLVCNAACKGKKAECKKSSECKKSAE